MKVKNGAWVIGLCFVMNTGARADSAVIPTTKDYDLSGVPPLTTSLLQQEREQQESKTLASFQHIVNDAVSKRGRRGRRAKGPKTKRVHAQKMASATAALMLQQASLAKEMNEFLQKQLEATELKEKTVSLHLKKIPVKEALVLVSKSSGLPMVVDGDVTGTVQELHLDDIPLAAALHSILTSNDPRLALIKDFGVWRVMKLQTAREIFASMARNEHEKSFSTAVVALKYVKWNDALKVRIEKLWAGITQGNTDKQNCFLVLDDENKKVFCKSYKTQVDEFLNYLREIDVRIPQIRIDARVVSSSKDFEEILGFNWSGVYNRQASVKHTDFVGLGPIQISNKNGATAATTFSDILGWSLNLLPSTVKSAAINVPFVFGNKDMNTKRLNLTLNAAENRNEAKTILNPSLLVYNGEMAEILVGQELPHEVRLDETVENKLTNVTTVNYKDIGMKIKVKPTVAPGNDAVFLEVFVENSEVAKPDFELRQGVLASAEPTASNFNYTIKTSRSNNRVLLKSGQTTLIGGLITKTKKREQTGVPLLQDIPGLGWLFRGRRKYLADAQLMIFITPTLVET